MRTTGQLVCPRDGLTRMSEEKMPDRTQATTDEPMDFETALRRSAERPRVLLALFGSTIERWDLDVGRSAALLGLETHEYERLIADPDPGPMPLERATVMFELYALDELLASADRRRSGQPVRRRRLRAPLQGRPFDGRSLLEFVASDPTRHVRTATGWTRMLLFDELCSRWSLDPSVRAAMIGIDVERLDAWVAAPDEHPLEEAELWKVGTLIGIGGCVKAIFDERVSTTGVDWDRDWPTTPNPFEPFKGDRPIDHLSSGDDDAAGLYINAMMGQMYGSAWG